MSTLDAISDRLTPVEQDRLTACENVIQRGLVTFIDVGEALLTVRDNRLYRASYTTFEAYCRDRWGFNDRRASQLIVAAEVSTIVGKSGLPAPANEAQARELAPLKDHPATMNEAWSEAVERTGGKPTAVAVREVVQDRKPKGPVTEDDSGREPVPGLDVATEVRAAIRNLRIAREHLDRISRWRENRNRNQLDADAMLRARLLPVQDEMMAHFMSGGAGVAVGSLLILKDLMTECETTHGLRPRRSGVKLFRDVLPDGTMVARALCPECAAQRDLEECVEQVQEPHIRAEVT